jgi:hypothetical protein
MRFIVCLLTPQARNTSPARRTASPNRIDKFDRVLSRACALMVFVENLPLESRGDMAFFWYRWGKIHAARLICIARVAVIPGSGTSDRCPVGVVRALLDMQRRAETLCRNQQPAKMARLKLIINP